MTVEIQTAIGPIAAEWDDLAERIRAAPFLRSGWTSAWWTAFGGGRLEIITLRRGGRLVALAPLKRVGHVLASTANWHSPAADILAEDESAAAEIADAIFAAAGRRVTLVFPEPSTPTLAACLAAAAQTSYRTAVRVWESAPYVEIRGSFEEYERTLDRSLRTNARRRRRRLEESGEVGFQIVEGGENLDEALREGFSIEGSGWKTEQGTAIDSQASTRRFYTDVARWAESHGWLHLAFLRLDGRPLAFHYNLRHEGVHYHLKGGYDPGFSRLSPSKLLHYEMLARAFAEGVASYEFLGGDEEWKREWAVEMRDRLLFEAFAPTATGGVEWAVHALARPVAVRAWHLVQRRASNLRRRAA